MATRFGHDVAPAAVPVDLGKTLFDPAPHGRSADQAPGGGAAETETTSPPASPPNHASALAPTVTDPPVDERARHLREAAVTRAVGGAAPERPATLVDPLDPFIGEPPGKGGPEARAASPGPRGGEPVLGKTLLLGGAPAGVLPPMPGPAAPASQHEGLGTKSPHAAPAPAAALGPLRPAARPVDASPLSMSVLAPSSWEAPPRDRQGQAPPANQPPRAGPVQPAPAGQPTPNSALAGTMSPANERTAAAGAKPGSAKQTMLGMPAADLPPPQLPPQAPPPALRTMIGVAMPGIAPTHDKPQALPPRAGTLLGVAVPGVAPVSPGRGDEARPPPQPWIAAPAPHDAPSAPATSMPPAIVPAPAPLVVEPLPEPLQVGPKKGVPAVVVVGVVFVLVALVGGAAAFVLLRAGAPLSAQPQLDDSGKESLRIRCESCPDGTVITLGASSTKVQSGVALLPVPAPLSIGDNDLEMTIDRPAPGRDETVKVRVPVAYRVKADLSTLGVAVPSITVRVEALPGTAVTVDGKPVALDASGRGSASIDVAADVEGTSDEQKAIDKKIPFAIHPQTGAPETGQLVVRAGVAPLHIDAPGRELYTDRPTAAISGQTKPGGTLTVDGQPVTVDPQGRFGVRVELPSTGDKTLTMIAQAPPLAPRTARAKVVRVASLDAAARTLEAQRPLAFDAFSGEPASKIGKPVVIDGEVLEIRVAQGYSVLLVEEKKACTKAGACVVRIVHGDEVKAARGDSVRAFGRLDGTVSSGGKTVPDVEGTLVIARGATKR